MSMICGCNRLFWFLCRRLMQTNTDEDLSPRWNRENKCPGLMAFGFNRASIPQGEQSSKGHPG